MAETIWEINEEKQYGAPLPSCGAVRSGCRCTDASVYQTDDAALQIKRLLNTHLDAFVISDGCVLVASLPDGSICEISLRDTHKKN